MTPSLDQRSAARILDLAESRGSRRGSLAGFALILLFAAHAALPGGYPQPAQAAALSPAGVRIHARESAQMKQLMAIGLAAAVSSGAFAQNAVQWRVEDGGNGHWYRRQPRSDRSWTQIAADSGSQGGYLATMTSPEERSLIVSVIDGNTCAIGGRRSGTGTVHADGWGWLTGEPMLWTNWASEEPNNSDAYGQDTEDVMGCFANGSWVDLANHLQWTEHYIIEWSADCNADGIVDYGQILAGELADANANNIPDCCENGTLCGCPGDTNSDGFVDGIDLATILTRWGQSAAQFPDADCNHDGAINGTDLAIVLGSWGACL